MRSLPLVSVLLLCVATDLVYRPFLDLGGARVDLPLIFLLWLASFDTRTRPHLLAAGLAFFRSAAGLDPFLVAWVPLAGAVELAQLLRWRFSLRSSLPRLPLLALEVPAVMILRELLRSGTEGLSGGSALAGSAILAIASGLVLFPIFDALRPLMRSHRFTV